MHTKVVIIAGPTASGKSSLAIELARAFNAELVSADSMQVYRHMDIGTAKPSLAERALVPHHLIDVADPDEEYTAARFRKDALGAISDIRSKGKNVFIAGGTGLYIKALTKGLFEGPSSDDALRERLRNEAAEKGPLHLHERLKEVDPESAGEIHPNNVVRVIRALEVYELTGRPVSSLRREHGFSDTQFDYLKIGLMKPRTDLYKGIDERVDEMMRLGLLEEVRRLIGMGYSCSLKPMRGLGYKEMCGFLNGQHVLSEAVELLKRNTRRYAKRQLTWFRKDPEIRWFSPEQKKDIIECVREYLL